MDKYRMVKCPTCGGDWYKIKLVKFNNEHREEWRKLEKEETQADRLCVVSIMAGVLASVFYILMYIKLSPAILFLKNLSEINQFLILYLGSVVIGFMVAIRSKKLAGKKINIIKKKKRDLLTLQGVRRNDSYEIVSKIEEDKK